MPPSSAAESYDWWAEAYDECNSGNDYELWVGQTLLPQLERHGLRRGSALDLGCGTGLAVTPLLRRGWDVVGCDVSSGMLRAAELKFGAEVRFLQSDVCDLPSIEPPGSGVAGGGFDFVLMLNDVVNYLTGDGDLALAFRGIKKNLGPGGLVIFDANTLGLFRRDYSVGVSENIGTRGWRWRGLTREVGTEQVFEGVLQDPQGKSQVHFQRHWSRVQIEGALAAAGLRCLAVLGQREEAGEIRLTTAPSETEDEKTLFIASHS